MEDTGSRDMLEHAFRLQYELQHVTYGHDFQGMSEEEKVAFIKDMCIALSDELHEFLSEVGWKPWATSRTINRNAAKGELVDLFHFFMNLCIVVGMGPHELYERYLEKRMRNIRRQEDGYDGQKGKCPNCHRDFSDMVKADGAAPLRRVQVVDKVFCSQKCAKEYAS